MCLSGPPRPDRHFPPGQGMRMHSSEPGGHIMTSPNCFRIGAFFTLFKTKGQPRGLSLLRKGGGSTPALTRKQYHVRCAPDFLPWVDTDVRCSQCLSSETGGWVGRANIRCRCFFADVERPSANPPWSIPPISCPNRP